MITNRKVKQLIRHAENISEKSTFKVQLGAVIFNKRLIVATGFNQDKTHPLPKKYFLHGTIHAEIDAVLHSDPDKLIGASILVFRKHKDGSIALSKPCPQCVQVLNDYGIEKAYWTCPINIIGYSLVKNLVAEIDRKMAYEINRLPIQNDE